MLKPFCMMDPTTVSEAVKELKRQGEGAKVYAGGAELVLLLRHGLVQATALVNIKRIAELAGVSHNGKGVRIGATVTHRQLETDSLVREHLPLLAYAESHVGNIRVRGQGTLGGNLCFADPHADPGTALSVHETAVKIAGESGERELPIHEFLLGMYETALQPEELLTGVEVAPLPDGWRWSYQRVERFYRPTVNVAAAGRIKQGKFEQVRLAVGCVGPKAQRLWELEEKLRGAEVAEPRRLALDSKRYLVDELQPVDDLLGSADYKIYITGVLVGRALEQVADGQGGSNG
jgi:carbon-monoxide dehydrogenase medium subunit